jgi:hypothetical protein
MMGISMELQAITLSKNNFLERRRMAFDAFDWEHSIPGEAFSNLAQCDTIHHELIRE